MATGDPISGLNGKAYHGSSPTEIDITGWTMEQRAGTLDTTRSSNATAGYRSKIADGFIEVSGTIEGLVLVDVDLPTVGASLTPLKLSSNSTRYWSGNAIVTKMGEALQVAGGQAVSFSLDFEGAGAWTKTDPTPA